MLHNVGKVTQCFDYLQEQTFKDKFMRREVLALTVCCTFQNEGCIWSGKVQHFEVIAAIFCVKLKFE